jgi:outer membrane lipoprotein SlyB
MQGKSGMLYPLMVIAAVSVILLSVVSIATMTGHIPNAVSQRFDAMQQGVVPSGDTDAPALRKTQAPTQDKDAAPPVERTVPIMVKRTTIPPPQSAVCSNCGLVQSVIAEEVKGNGSALGTAAGNEIEKTVKKSMRYVIRVHMEDGTTRVLTETAVPAFSAGQRVRIEDGLLAAAS